MFFLILILIICIILCGFSIKTLYQSKKIKIQKGTQQQVLIQKLNILKKEESNILASITKAKQEQIVLNDILKSKYTEKANLIEDIQQQQTKITSYYLNGKKHADEQLQIYYQTLKNKKEKDQNKYEQERAKLEESINQVRNELEKIEATRAAAQEAFLKEEKIKTEKEFYSLQLEDKSLHDIKILQSVEAELIDPRPLKMAIWTSCYSKRVNDLCSRIFGTAKKTGIYKITFLPTGQCYIGQARDLKERIREHCKAGFAQIDTPANNKLYEMMKKYPISDFTFELLQECPIDQLNEKEKYYIKLYQSYDFGFNSNKGIG